MITNNPFYFFKNCNSKVFRCFVITSVLILVNGLKAFAAPTNDDPCNAISLTPSSTCTYATYTNAAATATAGVSTPSCSSYLGGDVWFSIIVPSNGLLNIDTQTGVMTDGGMAVYTGTCGALTQIACDDDGSANGLMPQLNLTGLTPGTTIFIRIW